jgi:pimeloyl-ACP methyl ester carboxylesterase
MKTQYKLLPILLIISAFIVSCSKNNDPVIDEPTFYTLESDEYIGSMQPSISKLIFAAMAQQFDQAQGLADEVITDASFYKISYRTSFQGKPLLASGVVCMPDTPGSYPVISFQNGTYVEHNKAPSVDTDSDLFKLLKSVSTMGFIVVIPDYPGFGESQDVLHPYLEADNTVPSMIDMLKATREFSKRAHIHADLNNDLYLMGYSQGGWSTMQLQDSIEQAGLEDYTLKASSCGAGPYDLNYTTSLILNQETYPMPYFFAYLMHAYNVHEQFTNELDEIFADEYASKIPGLFDGVQSGEQINAQLTTQVDDLLQADYILGYQDSVAYEPIRQAFSANSVTAWDITTPVHLYHGANDTFVPVEVSQKLKADFDALNISQQVQLTILPDVNHKSAILPFGFATLKWFLELKNN